MAYFNGWYFKNTNEQDTISFIIGVSKTKQDKHSFIQIIDTVTNRSYYIRYLYEDFLYQKDPFQIKIKDNVFSKNGIEINIDDEVKIQGKLNYHDITPIKKSVYSPNIMGPFGYFKMECNHEITSLHHQIEGTLFINEKKVLFKEGLGYIERDYGTSFPEDYIWIQSNRSKNQEKVCFFFSYAKIPVTCFHFQGLISILYFHQQEYRFSTYYLAKTTIEPILNGYKILIHQGIHQLKVILKYHQGSSLIAPKKGSMKDSIEESLDSEMIVTLFEKGKIIFEEEFSPVTVEMVNASI